MSDHDEFCPGSTNECICVSLRRARADEREKYEQAWGTGIKAVEYRVTADLRAKVEALIPQGEGLRAWDAGRREAIRDVLALFGGGGDE